MNWHLLRLATPLFLATPTFLSGQNGSPQLDAMPPSLEMRFALSALPPAMRDAATVYRLDTAHGYIVAKLGSSGVSCIVQRTAWEESNYRTDVFVPRCYDREGSRTYLRVLLDAAAMRARGTTAPALKAAMESRYRTGRYRAPRTGGISYMLAPVMRTWLGDTNVVTMNGPHVMFYAPNVTDRDIGALPVVSHAYPFLAREGVDQQSFIIQLIGNAERATILADQKQLVMELCSFRRELCLAPPTSP